MKQVVIKRFLKQEDSTLNRQFEDFAGSYGFKPILCRPYCGQTKGKVARTVLFVEIQLHGGDQIQRRRLRVCLTPFLPAAKTPSAPLSLFSKSHPLGWVAIWRGGTTQRCEPCPEGCDEGSEVCSEEVFLGPLGVGKTHLASKALMPLLH